MKGSRTAAPARVHWAAGAMMALILMAAMLSPRPALGAETIKAGVLKYGTVNWLLDVVKRHKLDEKEGFRLETVELAGTQATQVSLLSGQSDTIVTDWFWVLQQRALGDSFVFIPYSVTLGAVMTPPDSAIKSVADLKGKRIGVAGGPLDKSWLMLRAYVKKQGLGDLAETATPIFGAPPLLNEQLLAGQIDAVLNNWNLAAKLEAAGCARLIGVSDMMKDFGIAAPLPLVGFVVSGEFAEKNAKLLRAFANAMQNAQRVLLTSDAEWVRIRPLMQAASDAEFAALRDRYREGLLHTWGERDRRAAARLFDLMVETGGEQLVGKGVKFDPGIFWSGLVF